MEIQMSVKSRLFGAASIAFLAMGAMGTTSANAFFFEDPHCVPGKWGCSGNFVNQETARARKPHGRDTTPGHMKYTDPRYSDAMMNAGGGGGGGGGGGR
jgi:hypothetical protein